MFRAYSSHSELELDGISDELEGPQCCFSHASVAPDLMMPVLTISGCQKKFRQGS